MIRVLIADDHAIVREGLKQILQEASDIVISDEAGDGPEALSKAFNNDYDVVLLDITMPSGSGLDVLKQLKSEKPKLPVLILTIHPEERYAVRVLRAGASGYITKNSPPDELIAAVRKVSGGGIYVSPALAEKLAFELKTNTNKPLHEMLSDREYQVMHMIASGKTVKEIAEELLLSIKTISTYREHVLTKMNMKNNVEITHYAIEHGLID